MKQKKKVTLLMERKRNKKRLGREIKKLGETEDINGGQIKGWDLGEIRKQRSNVKQKSNLKKRRLKVGLCD